ncbi:MAG: hypothetical protein WCL00_05160 [Bacteroidota bacterium]
MDAKDRQVLDGLKNLFSGGDQTIVATVTDQHPDDDFIDVEDLAGTPYTEVRKRAAIDGKKGILVTPVKGSTVIISKLAGNDSSSFVIVLFSEIESVKITLEDHAILLYKDGLSLNVSSGKFEIKNDQENLKGLLSDLISEIEKITVTTGTGPSGTPINIGQFQQLAQRVTKLLK